MARALGHEPGQPPPAASTAPVGSSSPSLPPSPPAGFTWGDYLAALVAQHGTLAAVAERLAALRGFRDDVASVERALRRLRSREQRDGGAWGARLLAAFGLPDVVRARARWMGAYHSRFVDLPLPLCEDLVRLWDRPPVSEDPGTRAWLAIAHATCALRAGDAAAAETHLARARTAGASTPPEARAELLLAEAFAASHEAPARVPALLARVEPLLAEPMPADDHACLLARWIDQRAYEINRGRDGRAPDYAAAEALYRALPSEGAPAFALCRRANGLAYARWKRGSPDEGAAFARAAAEHAGDGGHLRLRAMSLAMLARIVRGSPEGIAAWRRAVAIADALGDAALRARFESRAQGGAG